MEWEVNKTNSGLKGEVEAKGGLVLGLADGGEARVNAALDSWCECVQKSEAEIPSVVDLGLHSFQSVPVLRSDSTLMADFPSTS